MLARQAKADPKVPDESVSEMEPPVDSSQHDGMSNDGCKLLEGMSQDEQYSISDEQTRNLRRKDIELKPAWVLEVSLSFHVDCYSLTGYWMSSGRTYTVEAWTDWSSFVFQFI